MLYFKLDFLFWIIEYTRDLLFWVKRYVFIHFHLQKIWNKNNNISIKINMYLFKTFIKK